jgi:hypothetical protein
MPKLVKKLFIYFLSWRVLLFLPIIIGEKLLTYRKEYEYTTITYFVKNIQFLSNNLLTIWANFDGVHYLMIATNGYTDNGRFLPLYPILIHGFSTLFGAQGSINIIVFNIALLISNLSFLMSLFIFYQLTLLDYEEKIAWRSILMLLIFPTAFFFASIYTESLFLLLTLASLYCARKRNWLMASICGLFLAVTRPIGIIILPTLLVEFYLQERKEKKQYIFLKGIPLFFIPIGLIGYAVYNIYQWGDALFFMKAHAALANGRSVTSAVFIPQTLYRYFKILTNVPLTQFEWSIALLEVVSFIFAVLMIWYLWKKQVRLSYFIFSILGLLIPAVSGTFSGLPRYIIVLFPLFIGLGMIENKVVRMFYIIISVILLFLLTLFFSRGYYIA